MGDIFFGQLWKKLAWVLGIIVFFISLLLLSIHNTIKSDRPLKQLNITKEYLEVRGDILSSDYTNGFTLAKSRFLYKASIDTRYLNPNAKDLFISIFSIYSGIDKSIIRNKIDSQKKKGYLILSYNIPAHSAAQLNILATKLNYLEYDGEIIRVFKPLQKNTSFYSGLNIEKSGGKRLNPYIDTMTPLIGYVSRYETKGDITRVKGLKGLEKYYNNQLNSYKNGILQGNKDAVGRVIFNRDGILKDAIKGQNIKLNLSLKLQREIELATDIYKKKFHADEIIVSIMEAKTGKILALTSTNRYNPENIKPNEISHLSVNAVEMQFEPGSVIKPITMALVLDKNRTDQTELLKAYNKGPVNKYGEYKKGIFKLDRHKIRDDHNFKKRYITPSDIIVYSSNIGILQLAQRLSGQEFLDGFHSFGLGKKTGIDIADEKKGLLHSLRQYQAGEVKKKDNVYKATDSYGQGILSTFMQVLTAYNIFNNNGVLLKPKIASHIPIENGIKVISENTANIIKKMLIRTVNVGTGQATKINGLEIGGKTGTAQIARKGKYKKKYISSFFGFTNLNNKKYTIGVSVFNPSYKYHYASQSAVPIFKDVSNILLQSGYLD